MNGHMIGPPGTWITHPTQQPLPPSSEQLTPRQQTGTPYYFSHHAAGQLKHCHPEKMSMEMAEPPASENHPLDLFKLTSAPYHVNLTPGQRVGANTSVSHAENRSRRQATARTVRTPDPSPTRQLKHCRPEKMSMEMAEPPASENHPPGFACKAGETDPVRLLKISSDLFDENIIGLPTTSASRDSWADVCDEDADTEHMSVGSWGHPTSCKLPCKYAKKARGCKDGASCDHCHLCVWRKPSKARKGGFQ